MEEILYRYNPWWENIIRDDLVDRPAETSKILGYMESKQIILLTGLRRIGKTSLLKLIIKHLVEQKGIDPTKILYVSLDDYNLIKYSILEIVDFYRKIHSISFSEKIFLFLDEIAFKKDFELQLKNLFDHHVAKVIASTSGSFLIRQQKSMITGRSKTIEILPLDFNEYLLFRQIRISKADHHLLEKHFEEYLKTGGIPEYVLTGDPAYINELIDDIILKDIAAVFNIRRPSILQDYFLLLMERAGKQISLNKIASILKISVDTATRYFDMFVQANMVFTLTRYGKTNERLLAPKKIYAPDTGIRSYFTGFRDIGSLFENYVFLRIKSYQPEYLYQDQTELDFRLKNGFVIESKYHNEPLSDKQRKLFESIDEKQRMVIRNFEDLDKLIKDFNF